MESFANKIRLTFEQLLI